MTSAHLTIGNTHSTLPGTLSSALFTNLLLNANANLNVTTEGGVYVGEGLPPTPAKLAMQITHGKFVDMGELLPEF